MKTKMIIILSALLSAAMLASCGKKQEQQAQTKPDVQTAEAAKETVTGYLTSVKEKGPDQSTDYLAATASNNNAVSDYYSLVDSMQSTIAAVAGDDVASSVVSEAKSMMSEKLEYTVKDAKENSDGSVDVTAEIKAPDFSTVNITALDMNSAMLSIFGTTDYKEIAQKFAERKGLSVLDLAKYTNQNKLVADIFEAYKPELTQFFNSLAGKAQTTVTTEHFTVKKQSDGSWKIAEMSE